MNFPQSYSIGLCSPYILIADMDLQTFANSMGKVDETWSFPIVEILNAFNESKSSFTTICVATPNRQDSCGGASCSGYAGQYPASTTLGGKTILNFNGGSFISGGNGRVAVNPGILSGFTNSTLQLVSASGFPQYTEPGQVNFKCIPNGPQSTVGLGNSGIGRDMPNSNTFCSHKLSSINGATTIPHVTLKLCATSGELGICNRLLHWYAGSGGPDGPA